MLSFREMIEKALLLRESLFATSFPNPNISFKAYPTANFLLKNMTERWNQPDLGYFDPHFDKTHGASGIVVVGKDVYCKNLMLFV